MCLHLNATVEYITYGKPRWDADTGYYVDDDSEEIPTLVCPDCGYEEFCDATV